MKYILICLLNALTLTLVSTQCPGGYVYFAPSKKCYRLVKEGANWDNARAACRSQGGDLAVPTTQAEHEQLKQMKGFNHSAYIGARNNIRCESAHVSPDKRFWSVWDSKALPLVGQAGFQAWGTKFTQQPNFPDAPNEFCVVYYSDKMWHDIECGSARWYFCEIRLDKPCPAGYTLYPAGQKCYKFEKDLLKWHEARERCRSDQADLALPLNVDEHNFITKNKEFRVMGLQYIGGKVTFSSSATWAFTTSKSSNVLTWENWGPNDLVKTPENPPLCLAYACDKWHALDCNTPASSICEYQLDASLRTCLLERL